MKKALSIFIAIVLALQCCTVALLSYAASTTAEIQARINALPDASTLSLGQEPYRTEIINITKEMYELLPSGEVPNTAHLREVSAVVLTVSERCWALEPTGEPDDSSYHGGVDSGNMQTWLYNYSRADFNLYAAEVKALFLEIKQMPVDDRPKSNHYNRLRNQVDNLQSRGAFSTLDRLSCILPTAEELATMSDDDLLWYTKNNPAHHNEVEKTMGRFNQLTNDEIPQADFTALVEIAQRVMTLSEQIYCLPNYNDYNRLKNFPNQLMMFDSLVCDVYDRVFELDTTEQIPSDVSGLITAAQYHIEIADRAEKLPTIDEYYNHMSTNQQNAVHDEAYALYGLINQIDVTAPHPAPEDMNKLHAIREETFTIQERINVLPPKFKAENMDASDVALVADEVRYLYAYVDSVGEGTYPDITKLHSVAPVVLPLQEIIDHLPDVSALETAGLKYIQYIDKEIIYIRELVSMLDPSDPQPDTSKLDSIESFFGLNNITDIPDLATLKELLNEMNTGNPKIRTGNIIADFEIDEDISLNQGTLTLVSEDERNLTISRGFNVNNAKLNISTVSSTAPFNIEISDNGSAYVGSINVSGETASLNLYSCVSMTGNPRIAGIVTQGNAVINLFGCRIYDMPCVYAGPVNLGGTSTLNMYDGTVVENCSGAYGGFVSSTGAGTMGGFVTGAATINIFGGTVRNCKSTTWGGGAICIPHYGGVTINMTGGLIENCTALEASSNKHGGAIFLLNNSRFNLTGGEIRGCDGMYGGAVFAQSPGVSTIGGTVDIHDNEATSGNGGGVFYCTNANITIGGNAKLHNNKGTNSGVFFATGTVTITDNAEIYGNYSNGSGGVGVMTSGTMNVGGNAYIHENSCASAGGALYMSAGTLNIKDNAILAGNTAGVRAAAIYISTATANISGNVQFYDNEATQGAVAYLGSTGIINFSGGDMRENYAPALGGALYGNKGTINMSGGKIHLNQSQQGGAVVIAGAAFNMTGGEIYENLANKGGGLFVGGNGVATLTDGTITRNMVTAVSPYIGGGVYSQGTVVVGDGFGLYDNMAGRNADDLYSEAGSKGLTIGTACMGAELMCGHKVNGWFNDDPGDRYECFIGLATEPDASITPGELDVSVSHSLKAAHGPSTIDTKDSNGRILNELTGDEEINELSNNSAVTIYRKFQSTNADWYIGATEELPVGTKLTLMYYPNGTEASGVEYYHYEVTEAEDVIALSDFKKMGENTTFERANDDEYFVMQLAIVLPESNELDSVEIWIADTEYVLYYQNISTVELDFNDSVSKPKADISLSDEQGGLNSLTATATVENLGSLERDKTDPERMTGATLDDYTPLLTVELLNEFGDRVAFPEDSAVSINGTDIDIRSGIAVLPINSDGDYEIVAEGLTNGEYKLRASVCMASDSVLTNPMAVIIASATSSELNITRKNYAIRAELSGGKLGRVFAVPTEDKALSFNVAYIPDTEDAQDITIASYKKKADGTYAETTVQWSYSVSGSDGDASAVVTVPQDTAVGTYRIVFRIGDAVENYNIIITKD